MMTLLCSLSRFCSQNGSHQKSVSEGVFVLVSMYLLVCIMSCSNCKMMEVTAILSNGGRERPLWDLATELWFHPNTTVCQPWQWYHLDPIAMVTLHHVRCCCHGVSSYWSLGADAGGWTVRMYVEVWTLSELMVSLRSLQPGVKDYSQPRIR